MRILPWPLDPDEVTQVLRALQFRYYKWDIYHRGDVSILPDAIVLSPEEHATLRAAAEGVWSGLRELEHAICADAGQLEEVAVPTSLHAAIREQRPDQPRVTRCDFHPTRDGGWRISEFNDDVPSGFGECVGLAEILGDEWAERFSGLAFAGDLEAQLADALAPWPVIGLIHASAYSEDLQHVALVADWLRRRGHGTVLGSPANLRVEGEQSFLFDQPIDALFRYYPGEWLDGLPNRADWQAAARTLPMMNPLSALASQSKRFYATLDSQRTALSADAAAQIEAHLPASRLVETMAREQLEEERERWVLKGAFGRLGSTVYVGASLWREEWDKVLDEAFIDPLTVAAQERFDPQRIWFSRGMGYVTIGAYLVDGRFAGYFSRVDNDPLTNYDSWHVPTLVELP